MKYMSFNSSCSYAGVANMLERYGVDTDDRSIAMAMKLPYLFAKKNGIYMAGPMLQSADWFNLYLNPIGFEMIERELPAQQVAGYLKQQKVAMLGLRVDENGKHAVVYIGARGGKLVFLNNKWQHTKDPERITLTEEQLLSQLGDTAMIATLKRTEPKQIQFAGILENSVAVLRQNVAQIRELCGRNTTVSELRKELNTIFRPLLLDGITMLQLGEQTQLAERFTALQSSFLNALRQAPDCKLRLEEYLSVLELEAAAQQYIQWIQEQLQK